MITINQTFAFKGKPVKAYKIKLREDGEVLINGTRKYSRIKIDEEKIKTLNLRYKICENKGFGLRNKNNNLDRGLFKVKYNRVHYFITYLDEYELFVKVVLKTQ